MKEKEKEKKTQKHLRQSETKLIMDDDPAVPAIGVLYWNTGLWDWRTGLSPKEYEKGVRDVLESSKSEPSLNSNFVQHVVWRTSSAAWPSKFMQVRLCVFHDEKSFLCLKTHL